MITKNRIISKITKWGNGYGLRLPKDFVESFSGSKKVFEITNPSKGSFEVKEIKDQKIISTQEFIKHFKNNNLKLEEYDWGKPKGKEIW